MRVSGMILKTPVPTTIFCGTGRTDGEAVSAEEHTDASNEHDTPMIRNFKATPAF
jgi:hypothetical protein